MRKVLILYLLLAIEAGWAANIKGIKIAIENPSANDRLHADVVISIADLRKIAPDFTPGSLIVTATDAGTLEQDVAALEATELPSQVDDLTGRGHADEVAFQLPLKPHQTRIVTISYGDHEHVWRLRSDYPKRTQALFSPKIEGVGWESEHNAFRIYFDPRNAIDLYGKRRPTLQLGMFASPDYLYHDESPEGRDIYKVGNAIGIGAVAALVDGKAVKVADVKDRKWHILSSGPVRSIVEIEYTGWNMGGKLTNLRARITQWAGERGFYHQITSSEAAEFVTGLPLKPGLTPITSPKPGPAAWMATWGEQVVQPGPNATEAIHGQNLGLAVITERSANGFADDAQNHFMKLSLANGEAEWYAMAAWDQEGTENRRSFGNRSEMGEPSFYGVPPDAITTRDSFLAEVRSQSEQIANPVKVTILSKTAVPQPPPLDTTPRHHSKTYREAIDLIRHNVDRTAEKWTPIVSGTPANEFSPGQGRGFFTEADNASGEWKPRAGFFWTGGFWTGELWQLYRYTHEEKYRRWAELWTSRLVGKEMNQNHDAGVLYFYSSALGYDLVKGDAFKESALRAADRLTQLYNPKTQLIPAWSVNGDDTIIDTMMNLQILWWASRRTGDPKWKEIGLKHALRSADWLVRPNGLVVQSVHYNPGDNRQAFVLHGGAPQDMRVLVPNHATPGEWIFYHTHQGFAADTPWARGTGWALYGFTTAFEETRDPKLLAMAERIADFALEQLSDDGIPWYDLYDEGVRFRNRDTSAGAIIAGGLLRLSLLTSGEQQAQRYRHAGERIMHSLIDRYLTPVGENDRTPGGVLRHGCSTRPADAMLIYGQYYLLEDLLWLEQHPATAGAQAN